MFDDPDSIARAVNAFLIAFALVWVAHSAVKKERKRRYYEDVEKGMQARKNKSSPVAQDQSANDQN